MRTPSVRLGELLEKRCDVSREQILRALRSQKVLGGRLGTCLLEIEALTEDQLCRALAEQLGVPFATPEDLRGIPDETLALLPSKVARRCKAIAFQASATQVKVALLDAQDLSAQDEISFVVGKRIRWYVALELRLFEALEKHYGEECPPRLARLLDKMNRSRFLWTRESGAGAAPDGTLTRGADQLQWDARVAGGAAVEANASATANFPASVSVELPHFQHQTLDLPTVVPVPAATPTTAPDATPAPVPRPAAASAPMPVAPRTKAARAPKVPKVEEIAATVAEPPATPTGPGASPPALDPHRRRSIEETEQRLLQPHGRDDVARAILDFAAGLLPRAVLFVVRKSEIAAWLWSGDGIDEARLAALRLNLKQPSFFAGLKEQGAYFRGPLSPLPEHVVLMACFTSPPITGDVLALPVKVKDRLVAALVVEPRPAGGAGLTPADLADLQRVIAKAEIGFELCIMQTKLRRA